MAMNKKTLTALKESIEHWYRISACKTPGELKKEGWTYSSCSLCEQFVFYDCSGCPVRKKTKQPGCVGSPWSAANVELCDYVSFGKWSDESQKIIEAEIRFLESLLPKGHRYWEGDEW